MKWSCLLFAMLVSSYLHSESSDTTLADTSQVNRLTSFSKKSQWVDPYQSLDYADQALQLALNLNYKRGIASAYNLKGFCYWTLGDNDLAIQSAMEAIQVEKENLPVIQSESYYILARGYMDLGETKKARESIIKAEELAEGNGNWEQLCSIYNLKGVILFIDHKMDSALYFYNKAYEVGKAHAVEPINLPRIISNIGECYSVENPELAFKYFSQGLSMARETGNKITEASITAILGQAYLREKDLKNAENHFTQALQLARNLGLRRVIRHAYAGLVDIKLQQGKGDEAVIYLRKYYSVRDSLLNTSKIRQIVELEAKHELALKEQNIKLLESEASIQTIWRNLLIGLVIILILLSIGLYQLQRYRYKKNREMLDLEIDYLTRQHQETMDRFKASAIPESESEASLESYDQKLLRKAISIVETNMSDSQLSVEKMASEMSMSRTSLHRKIKSITGFAPSELIRSIRLRKAAKLIINKVDTVSQIAQLVGFDDYSHFSKAFKKHFGVSPTSYEEQNKLQKEIQQELDGQ